MAGADGGDGVRVNVDTLLGAAGWMDSVADDFNNDVQKLMRDVRQLLERWRGSAADSHSDAWTDWYSKANNLVGALVDDANALRATAQGYVGTDDGTATGIGDAGNRVKGN